MLRQFFDIELFIENKINIPSIGYYLCHRFASPYFG
jgi:hypothetical protein